MASYNYTLPEDLNSKFERVKLIYQYCRDKYKYHFDKCLLTSDYEEFESLETKYKLYQYFAERAHNLLFNLKFPKQFGTVPDWLKLEYKYCLLHKKEQKAKRKKEFEKNYRVQVHFMQTSLSADYGSFTCEKCNRNFYHSPSTILLGKALLYKTCCGYCVNDMLSISGQKQLFF
ncbi:MAG: hypothetical protein O9302_03240 [Cyclobacteriaceae bacterium]|jgi:hypothetical protein|nr:hypothetical protein [Cytophagales bacterium]MCZ8327051.1 hypothetical protein [Cyclobacteriaceae bacterium]